MGFKFRKSISLAPGVKLNMGKKSAGISVGGKYARTSFNTKSGVRASVSAPGTGISYDTKIGGKKSKGKTTSTSTEPAYVKSGSKRKQKKEKKKSGCLTPFIIFLLLFSMIGSCSSGEDDSAKETTLPTTSPTFVSTESTTESTVTVTETTDLTEATIVETEAIVTDAPATVPVETSSAVPEETNPPQTEPTERMVWIPTKGGKKYHSKSSCSSMDNPEHVTISQAKARGFTACGRCY